MVESDAIDRTVLAGLLVSIGDDREFLQELVETFFEDSPNLLEALHVALAARDAEAVRRAAHSLKSTSANFGAMVFSGMCKELEDMAKVGALEGVVARIVDLEEEYARLRAALELAAAA
jgi:HPt (histidine-containing phosphotransfer) domain-containing protein